MIVWTFTTSFVGQRDFIPSTTICIKEFCIYDRYMRFLFLCLVSFSRFTASFSWIEWARSHTMLKMRANPGSLKSHDTFFCFVLACFPKSSYLPVFCDIFTATQPWAGVSIHLTILVTKTSSLSLSQLRASYLQSWDPPILHIHI